MEPVKNKIVIYTTSWCPYCVRAKELLRKKGVAFEEYDIEEVPGARESMQLLSGSKTVPQVYLGNTLLGGCDDLYALDERGDLDIFLATAYREGEEVPEGIWGPDSIARGELDENAGQSESKKDDDAEPEKNG
ncbi:MAG: glutaredoxin 3 [Gammaproteobacteria bacterium AqS3]|nr:glutaredoxin 3 [Gammaproteobacteria bacterium AqS3]